MSADLAGWSGEEMAGLTAARRRARAAELCELGALVEAGVWMGRGFRSPSAWLAAATGEPLGACKRSLHLADRLGRMPHVAEVFASGLMSEAALGVLADAWAESIAEVFERDVEMLARWAVDLEYRDAKLVIETWAAHADPDRVDRGAEARFDRRRLHVSSMLDGMVKLDAVLDPEGAAYVCDAIRWLAGSARDPRTPAQRRHDGLVEMARFVLTHRETPVGGKRQRPKVVVTTSLAELEQRAAAGVAPAGVGAVGGLQGHQVPAGVGHVGSLIVGAEAVRRLACDAGVHRLVTAGSAIIDYGRQTRSISDALFEVLSIRDGGCRWPGCEIDARFCDAHHAVHWADHGDTEPDNLPLLCWYHHHVVHEDGWSIEPLGAGLFQLHTPSGLSTPLRPPRLQLIAPT